MPIRTFDDGFFPASRARDIAAGNGSANSNVLTEINALQIAINDAAKDGKLSVEVGLGPDATVAPGTVGSIMTDSTLLGQAFNEAFTGTKESFDAFNTANGTDFERQLLLLEMERVIGYFTRLGYQINRRINPTLSPETFDWVIKW